MAKRGDEFERVCFWLERLWRYRRISKKWENYTIRRFEQIVEIRSLDKEKLYTLIVSNDFIRLEFVVAFQKLIEFFEEMKTLNYYFEGALSPFLWKLNECGKTGACRVDVSGVVRGLYHIIPTPQGMIVGIDFIAKSENGESKFNDIFPLNFQFKGVYSLDRFVKNFESNEGRNFFNIILTKLQQLISRFR